jgi:DNA-binding NarL/FixJ family response regulator
MSRPRVLLADDHRIVSDGLKSLLADDFDLVGVVEDGEELIPAAKTLSPDVIIADISMPKMSGIEAVGQLKRDNPSVKVVFLTMHQDPAYAQRAVAAGGDGYVVKQAAVGELVLAVRAALRGQTFISPSIASLVLRDRQNGTEAPERALTKRQREILGLVMRGSSAKKIAAKLNISPRTVEFHKYQIMQTFNLHNTAELIHFALKQGISPI